MVRTAKSNLSHEKFYSKTVELQSINISVTKQLCSQNDSRESRTVITKTAVRKKQVSTEGIKISWCHQRGHTIALWRELLHCSWMGVLSAPATSAPCTVRRPVAFAFLTLWLVLLVGLVAMLVLCRHCSVPRCCCRSKLQVYGCFFFTCRLILVPLFLQCK